MKRKRASSLNMCQSCPGYAELAEAIGDRASTDELARGTRVHASIARYLSSGAIDCTDDDRSAVEAAIAYLDGLCLVDLDPEVRISDKDGQYIGTVDVISESGRCIVDWKTGRGDRLPAMSDDLQMLAYGCGALHTHPDWPEVSVHRVSVDEGRADIVTITRDELSGLDARTDAIHRNGSDLVLGSHCDGCLLRRFCPKVAEGAVSIRESLAKLESSSIRVENDEQAVKLHLALPMLEEMLSNARESLKNYLSIHEGATHGKTSIAIQQRNRKTVDLDLNTVMELFGSGRACQLCRLKSMSDLSAEERDLVMQKNLYKSATYNVVVAKKVKQ